MTKKLLVLFAALGLMFTINGCTSKKSQDETQVVENADVEKIDAEATPTSTAELDPSLQAALGEAPAEGVPVDPAATVDDPTAAPADVAAADTAAAPTVDETSLNDVPAPAVDSAEAKATDAELDAATQQPATAENVNPDAPAAATETVATTEEAPKTTAKVASGSQLKKIALTPPYQADGGWINTVYVARPGETLKDVSQKIFSADKTKELKKIAENSYLKSRKVKAGDKIYYVSPNRPEDSTKTLFYYEDVGLTPETYVAKKGDNLRKIAKEVLGYDNAWIEMWTSNPVESKKALTEGETIKFWNPTPSLSAKAPTALTQPDSGTAKLVDVAPAPQPELAPPPADAYAANNPPPATNELPPPPDSLPRPPAESAATPPPPADANALPPPPDTYAANSAAPTDANALPPPPPEASLPPPPPPEDLAPPPPLEATAPIKKKPKQHIEEEVAAETGGLDEETMMSIGVVGVLFAVLAVVLIRRKKKKAAELAASNADTHVGT